MWQIFGSKSEYEAADAEEAERHWLVWIARMNARAEKQKEVDADAAEAEHDAAIGW